MMEYKRVTDKDWHKEKFYGHSDCERTILKRLWDLENKIEQGTLIELPCKVGDWLYVIYDNKIIPRMAFAFEISGVSRYIKTTMGDIFVDSCIGKTLFFTREEAEKRLKELQNG